MEPVPEHVGCGRVQGCWAVLTRTSLAPPHFPFVGHTAFERKLNFRKQPASARFVPSSQHHRDLWRWDASYPYCTTRQFPTAKVFLLIGPDSEQPPYGGCAAVAPDTRPALWCRTSLLCVSKNKNHDTSMSCEDRSLAPYMEVAHQSSLMAPVQLPDPPENPDTLSTIDVIFAGVAQPDALRADIFIYSNKSRMKVEFQFRITPPRWEVVRIYGQLTSLSCRLKLKTQPQTGGHLDGDVTSLNIADQAGR